MHRRCASGFVFSLIAILTWAMADAQLFAAPFDWPQWQGADRTGVSKETGLLKSWPKEGPPLAWKAKGVGEGYSTPSIADGRIFAMGNREKKEYVVCLAEDGGK